MPNLIEIAALRAGMPYQLDPPPDGIQTIDCSLYVLLSYEDAGLPIDPDDVGRPAYARRTRTAEQIRQATVPIPFDQVEAGDLLFFRGTYAAGGQPGPDGLIASHIGLSLGRGTLQMWNAVEYDGTPGQPGVVVTNLNTDYWQGCIIEARRHPSLLERAAASPQSGAQDSAGLPVAVDSSGAQSGSQRLIHAIDVSNYQPQVATAEAMDALLASLSPRPSHVIVRIPLSVERNYDQLRQIAAGQLAAARVCGASTSGYVWGYGSLSPEATVQEAIGFMVAVGAPPAVLWLDLEDGTDPPSAEWVSRALAECSRQCVQGGVYTGAWWWNQHMQNVMAFAGQWLWTANYNGRADLETPSYGGLVVVGRQWTDSPVDRSVFVIEATGARWAA